MKALIQRSARDDIIRQYMRFVEVESEDLADRFLLSVNQAVDKIAAAPLAGSPRHFANPALAGLRMWRIEGFDQIRVYYVVRNDVLTIIRVLHNRRDFGAIFEDQGFDEPEME